MRLYNPKEPKLILVTVTEKIKGKTKRQRSFKIADASIFEVYNRLLKAIKG